MSAPKNKTAAKSKGKFKDLKSKKSPKGGFSSGGGGGTGKISVLHAGWVE